MTYISHITYITHIVSKTHVTYITHMMKLIFKTYKKNKYIKMKYIYKYIMYKNLYIKMTNNYHKKHKENLRQESPERYQNISEKGKDRKNAKKGPRKISKFYRKRISIIVNVIKIFPRNKSRS